ncbi:MAG: glycosyltransferase family 2 protein [Lachnospiraceae bacterium]|nr:glycosyltransferase family 2 protein [Lachnospiraceae bacterium]
MDIQTGLLKRSEYGYKDRKHRHKKAQRKETSSKMETKLSIIIAICDADNDTKRIKETVDSALSQKDAKTEILLCADVVSEKVKAFLSEYEKNEKVNVFYTSERRGKGGAYNLGLRKADKSKGNYICFLNAGDTLDPGFAKKLLAKANECKADAVACANNTEENDIDSEVFSEALQMEDYDKKALLCVNPGSMESKIYKTQIFEENGLWFPENLLFEKSGIGRLALLCAENFEYFDEELYSFGKKPENDITEEDLYDRLDVMSFFMEECYKREFLEEFPEEVESACIDDMYMKTLFTYIAITPAKKRKQSFLKMLQEAMLDCFPEFETNPYYYEKYDDDIKDLVTLHMENPNKFLKATMKMESL